MPKTSAPRKGEKNQKRVRARPPLSGVSPTLPLPRPPRRRSSRAARSPPPLPAFAPPPATPPRARTWRPPRAGPPPGAGDDQRRRARAHTHTHTHTQGDQARRMSGCLLLVRAAVKAMQKALPWGSAQHARVNKDASKNARVSEACKSKHTSKDTRKDVTDMGASKNVSVKQRWPSGPPSRRRSPPSPPAAPARAPRVAPPGSWGIRVTVTEARHAAQKQNKVRTSKKKQRFGQKGPWQRSVDI